MNCRSNLVLIAAVLLQVCVPAPEDVIEDASDALGGAEAIPSADALVLESTGQTYRLGQQPNPDADLPIYELRSYREEMGLQGRRWRVGQVRTGHLTTGFPVRALESEAGGQ